VSDSDADRPAETVRARALELARRLNLLQDVHASENDGKPLAFTELRDRLLENGVNLSEGRWAYMLSGQGALTTDSRLLTELARIFEVDASYLLDWEDPELPARILANRELIATFRRNKIIKAAARSLGPLTPKSIEALSKIIDAEMSKDFRDKDQS
jgi:hypothetical protein